ncbi:MAG: GIY-YIG nuclease family protein [Bacteroidota bacterium]
MKTKVRKDSVFIFVSHLLNLILMPGVTDWYYYIYIVTNPERKELYTGITNKLVHRLTEHWNNRGKDDNFV